MVKRLEPEVTYRLYLVAILGIYGVMAALQIHFNGVVLKAKEGMFAILDAHVVY
jgi:hypothetical protein